MKFRRQHDCYYVYTVNDNEIKDWIIFYFRKHFEISYAICGYFDNRPEIEISLFFFGLTIKLPIRNKWNNECDPPKWGIAYHNESFWIYMGGKGNMNGGNKCRTIDSPFSLQWVRTSTLLKTNEWFNETEKQRLRWGFSGENTNEYGGYEWLQENRWKETHDYTYVLKNGNVQHRKATIGISEREWRMHWFKWIPFIKKESRSIDIEFDDEVGEESGSWKGGTIGCNYKLLKNETPEECLRRMEKERKF